MEKHRPLLVGNSRFLIGDEIFVSAPCRPKHCIIIDKYLHCFILLIAIFNKIEPLFNFFFRCSLEFGHLEVVHDTIFGENIFRITVFPQHITAVVRNMVWEQAKI